MEKFKNLTKEILGKILKTAIVELAVQGILELVEFLLNLL